MSRKLLLVEDDTGARTILSAALRARGLDVRCAGDVAEALRISDETTDFDAVVTDIVLEHDADGGLDLIPELRRRGVSAPFVVVTAFADKRRLKRAIELHVAYLLEKPFGADQLLGVLSRVWSETPDLGQLVRDALSVASLTSKEEEIARLVLKGLSNQEIATALAISDKTVRQHLSAVYAKCGVSSRAEFFHHVFPT
jgi:DNA-binding NarL/FixJ family response regulator